MENNKNNENQEQINEIEEVKEVKISNENKKKISIKEMISNKKLRYGAYASVMTLAVIAIIIVLNLVVGQLGIKFDLTKDKMYSLSDQTVQIVTALDKPVNIYPIYSTGSENTQFIEILDKYKALSKNITITTKDPNLNPQFINQYVKDGETIAEGSVIVESGDKFKVLSQYDLYDVNVNYQTYQQEITGIALEPKVTGAIQYVTTNDLPIAYVLQGHSEPALNDAAKQSLVDENYEVKDLDILTQGSVPEDTSILVVNAPARDYSKEETEKLTDYLVKGGRAIFILNLYTEAMPNYESVLATYGVKPQNLPVVEGNGNNALQNNPLYLIPNMESHDITSPIKNNKLRVIIPMTQAIELLKDKGVNTKITPLLTTSEASYAKKNISSKTVEKEQGDIPGPLNLAVLVEDAWFNDATNYESKIIVISSSSLFDMDQLTSGANIDFFMNCVNFLVDKKDSISIRSKSLETQYLSLNQTQALAISAVAVIVIPTVILAIGIAIWLRRRNK